MARTPKPLNEDTIFQLAKLGLTQEEIAAVCLCSVDTLDRRFRKELDDGKLEMKASLKRTQYDVAVNQKNTTMLIWLGKQHLGQQDRLQSEVSGPGGGPIESKVTIELVRTKSVNTISQS